MRVKWLRKALENIDQEATCIALDYPTAATQFILHFQASALELGNQEQ